MHPNKYQQLAQRTSNDLFPKDKIINGAMGLAGEAGEVIDHVKKWRYQGHELDKDELINEAGDVLWYVAQLCEGLGVSIEEVMVRNIDKLSARYPEGFEEERSVNR